MEVINNIHYFSPNLPAVFLVKTFVSWGWCFCFFGFPALGALDFEIRNSSGIANAGCNACSAEESCKDLLVHQWGEYNSPQTNEFLLASSSWQEFVAFAALSNSSLILWWGGNRKRNRFAKYNLYLLKQLTWGHHRKIIIFLNRENLCRKQWHKIM